MLGQKEEAGCISTPDARPSCQLIEDRPGAFESDNVP
jgi:hypothetical protein